MFAITIEDLEKLMDENNAKLAEIMAENRVLEKLISIAKSKEQAETETETESI